MAHISVLQKEVIEYLDPKPNQNFIDCTTDGGGHTAGILEKTAPKGTVLGMDWDQEMISRLKTKSKEMGWGKRFIPVNDNFANLKEVIKRENFKKISGILFDLGFSSYHPDESRRGFTFQKQEPLDMRYDENNPLTAEKILSFYSEQDLERILTDYGEEKFAKEIAREIIIERRNRDIKNTFQLVSIIKRAIPEKFQRQKINPATRTFQALRIAVNDELGNIKKGLASALETVDSGGRVVVISFHSLEDRIVKNFIKDNKNNLQILTKKPISPKWDEIRINPRSRSAKLRAFKKI